MPKRRKWRLWLLVPLLPVGAALAYGGYLYSRLGTLGEGESTLVRLDRPTTVLGAMRVLHDRGIVRDADAMGIYARLTNQNRPVRSGTYRIPLNQGADPVFRALSQPMRQMVRLPETNWAQRNANLLERAQVCDAEEYLRLVRQPQLFQSLVSFPLPKVTLEGYLYPDTYDLPPLIGARAAVERQLKTFERKVWKPLGKPKDLDRLVKIASLVELETKLPQEKPVVAGVIENRLDKGMRLQIDAAINYGLQKWRPLLRSEYQSVQSPYNLYRHDGLPPTPICSPTVASMRAAMRPARHPYLYYVALPDGRTLFSATYGEHLRNIGKRKAALAAQ